MEAVKSFIQSVKSPIDLFIAFPIGLVLFLFAVRLVFADIRRCYLLLARMYAGTRKEGVWSILGALLGLALQDFVRLKLFKTRMLRRVRMRVEHEIFRPRPVLVWPLPDDHPDYDGEAVRSRSGFSQARARHADRLQEWRRAMARIYAKGDNQIIRVDTPAAVNARFSEIRRYFDTLKSLGLEEEDDEIGDSRKFVCAMVIGTGFVTPIHLLTGLLIQFNQKWPTILTAFNRDANDLRGLRAGLEAADLRQIQMFVYNCWLLWGPSIPICNCPRWRARYIAIQYGFGDENNSIELVGAREAVSRDLADLFRQSQDQMLAAGKAQTAMALPATVRGRLQLSGSLKERDNPDSPLPVAARDSWGGQQDERPVLFVSESEEGDAVKGDIGMKDRILGRITPDAKALKSRYYSAYLWAAFMMLRHDGQGWVPVSSEGRAAQPWKDLIPFFEHGNLADPETCQFSKSQLAAKALNGIADIVRNWHGAVPLRFAFAAAVDESGCGQPLAFPDWAGGVSMRRLLKDGLKERALAPTAEGAVFARILREDIILFDHYGALDGMHDYSACHLPIYIDRHYQSMDI